MPVAMCGSGGADAEAMSVPQLTQWREAKREIAVAGRSIERGGPDQVPPHCGAVRYSGN
jgi:hypothetical protein